VVEDGSGSGVREGRTRVEVEMEGWNVVGRGVMGGKDNGREGWGQLQFFFWGFRNGGFEGGMEQG